MHRSVGQDSSKKIILQESPSRYFSGHSGASPTFHTCSLPGIGNFFLQIFLEAHHLYVILRADHEYRVYILIGLSLIPEKCILPAEWTITPSSHIFHILAHSYIRVYIYIYIYIVFLLPHIPKYARTFVLSITGRFILKTVHKQSKCLI